jgi:hypothetical protein
MVSGFCEVCYLSSGLQACNPGAGHPHDYGNLSDFEFGHLFSVTRPNGFGRSSSDMLLKQRCARQSPNDRISWHAVPISSLLGRNARHDI